MWLILSCAYSVVRVHVCVDRSLWTSIVDFHCRFYCGLPLSTLQIWSEWKSTMKDLSAHAHMHIWWTMAAFEVSVCHFFSCVASVGSQWTWGLSVQCTCALHAIVPRHVIIMLMLMHMILMAGTTCRLEYTILYYAVHGIPVSQQLCSRLLGYPCIAKLCSQTATGFTQNKLNVYCHTAV